MTRPKGVTVLMTGATKAGGTRHAEVLTSMASIWRESTRALPIRMGSSGLVGVAVGIR